VREDGGAVREDDAEPELLDNENKTLEEGAVVAMAVKESPLVWRTFPDEYVELSEDGTVATKSSQYSSSHVTTGVELIDGRHYWEVELRSEDMGDILVGVTRPNLDHSKGICYMNNHCNDSWFTHMGDGTLFGNGKYDDDEAGAYDQGDRLGVLLDLNNGSLLFFKNGVQHGPGYAAGSVTGPVVAAVELDCEGEKVQLHADVAFPAGHAQ
jgi:hypothetical protein